MKKLKNWITSVFSISKTESNGYIALFVVMIIALITPYVIKRYYKQNPEVWNPSGVDSLIAKIEANTIYDSIKYKRQYKRNSYKKKASYPTQRTYNKTKPKAFPEAKIASKPKKIQPFDINSADTSQLKKVRGIGTVLSRRIVKYRDLLGGFVSKSQLNDVYGLHDSTLQSINKVIFVSSDFQPKRILINQSTTAELKKHPYITYKMANAIVNYRFQHGTIEDEQTLHKIHLLDSGSIAKIISYIDF